MPSNPAAKNALIFKRLKTAPETQLLGVLDGGGIGCVQHQGDRLWTIMIPLVAWRQPGGPIQRRTLTIRKQLGERQLDRIRLKFEPFDILRLRARLAEKNVTGSPQGLLVGAPSKWSRDAELSGAVRELKKPVRIKDKTLGSFTLDRSVDWFEGKARWAGRPVQIHLHTTGGGGGAGAIETLLAAARALWTSQRVWQRQINSMITSRLLRLRNTAWLEDNEKPVAAAALSRAVRLESVSVYPDGSLEFWHRDGNHFGGHMVVMTGSVKKGVRGVRLEG